MSKSLPFVCLENKRLVWGSGAKVEPKPNKPSRNFFKRKQNKGNKHYEPGDKRTKLLTKPVERMNDGRGESF